MVDPGSVRLLHLLVARLERISADSYWAHQASGIRGVLLRMLVKIDRGQPVSGSVLRRAMDQGFEILRKAVEERNRASEQSNGKRNP